jgi:predicted alternative tryptophan synthase beta-subunit
MILHFLPAILFIFSAICSIICAALWYKIKQIVDIELTNYIDNDKLNAVIAQHTLLEREYSDKKYADIELKEDIKEIKLDIKELLTRRNDVQ